MLMLNHSYSIIIYSDDGASGNGKYVVDLLNDIKKSFTNINRPKYDWTDQGIIKIMWQFTSMPIRKCQSGKIIKKQLSDAWYQNCVIHQYEYRKHVSEQNWIEC